MKKTIRKPILTIAFYGRQRSFVTLKKKILMAAKGETEPNFHIIFKKLSTNKR